jgi:hypothetical protein
VIFAIIRQLLAANKMINFKVFWLIADSVILTVCTRTRKLSMPISAHLCATFAVKPCQRWAISRATWKRTKRPPTFSAKSAEKGEIIKHTTVEMTVTKSMLLLGSKQE